MSEIERKQAAEGLIEQLKREVAVGADPRQTFEEIQRLTPYVEADARRREALDFEIWMALKDNASVQQQAPSRKRHQNFTSATRRRSTLTS